MKTEFKHAMMTYRMKSSENCSLPYTLDLKSEIALENLRIGLSTMVPTPPLPRARVRAPFNQQGAIIQSNPFLEGRPTSEGLGTS